MRRIFTLFALLLLPMGPAGAYGMSQSHFSMAPNGSMADCLQRARLLLEAADMRILGTGAQSIGAEPAGRAVLVTAYCVPAPGIMLMTVAGNHTSDTAPVLERLRAAWQGSPARPRK